MHNHVFSAQILELSNRVLSFPFPCAVNPGPDLVAKIQGHAGRQSGFEAAAHLGKFEPGIEPEAKTARGEHAASGLQDSQAFRRATLDRTLHRRRPPLAKALRAVLPKLSPTRQED